jgi:hypothetical protein
MFAGTALVDRVAEAGARAVASLLVVVKNKKVITVLAYRYTLAHNAAQEQ